MRIYSQLINYKRKHLLFISTVKELHVDLAQILDKASYCIPSGYFKSQEEIHLRPRKRERNILNSLTNIAKVLLH